MTRPVSVARFVIAGAVLFSANETIATTADPDECERGDFTACLNGVTSAVTSIDLVRVTGSRVTETLKEREQEKEGRETASLGGGGLSGFAAGEMPRGWGIWGSYNFSDFESENAIAPYEGDINSVLFGVDLTFAERFVIGVAAGYEITDTETFYNAGNGDTDGVTVAPYAAFLINDTFSLDAAGGYTSLENEQDRTASNNGARLSAEFDSDRWFATANLNAIHSVGNFSMAAHGGFLYTREDQDPYTETGASTQARTVRSREVGVNQLVLGADLAYSLGTFEPYALINYRNDLHRLSGRGAGGLPSATGATQSDDDDEVEAGLGVRYFGQQGLTGALEWFWTLGREEFDNRSLMLTLRLDM